MSVPAALPESFVGAWRRVSIALGDAPPHEPSDVMWLQARDAFADVRLPLGRGVEPAAFAGTTTWDPPALTWHHLLDLAPCAPDVGVVEWRGDDLVERGATYAGGELVTYEEVWRRAGGASPILVLTSEAVDGACRGTLVRVGDEAIVMALTEQGLSARRDRRSGAAWRTVGSVGPAVALPAIPEPRGDWEPGVEVRLAPVPTRAGEPSAAAWWVRELEA